MKQTVRDCTFGLLRQLGITTIVGNPGSTEETFLQNFPKDFHYVLALQEASVVGIADGLGAEDRKHGKIRGLRGRDLKAQGHGQGLRLGEGVGGVAAGCHRSGTDQ